MAFSVKRCEFNGYKVSTVSNGVYVGACLPFKKKAGIVIYNEDKTVFQKIEFDSSLFVGDVVSCIINKLSIKDKFYRFFIDDDEVIDKYCKAYVGNEVFGRALDLNNFYAKETEIINPKGWDNDKNPMIPFPDAVLYMAHMRGLTMNDEGIKDNRGTFKAAATKANYLKKLGVTSVIFMPVYERIELTKTSKNSKYAYRNVNNELPVNYWGFGSGFYYAPKASYSSSEDAAFELKSLVKSYHDKNIEVILAFDFCLLPYEEISSILRYWIYEYHIDGFRIFGTNEYKKLLSDPFLKNTKLIFNGFFDELNELKLLKYKNVAVIDNEFRNLARRFLKGDEDCVGKFAAYIRENHNGYAVIRNLTDFDGFTLNDLVSYDRKHNEDNLEDNTDGTDYNYSWNCGSEGPATKKAVSKLRARQIRNAIMLTFLCQGTPMISSGDELLNSTKGNNNPYCQDNEIGWVSYNRDKASKTVSKLVSSVIMFRNSHKILHQDFELKGYDYLSCKLPDISYHSDEAWRIDTHPDSRGFSVLYGGDYSKQYTSKKEPSVLITYNMHWDEKKFWMPRVDGFEWKLIYSTELEYSDFDADLDYISDNDFYLSKGRTISIFTASKKNR